MCELDDEFTVVVCGTSDLQQLETLAKTLDKAFESKEWGSKKMRFAAMDNLADSDSSDSYQRRADGFVISFRLFEGTGDVEGDIKEIEQVIKRGRGKNILIVADYIDKQVGDITPRLSKKEGDTLATQLNTEYFTVHDSGSAEKVIESIINQLCKREEPTTPSAKKKKRNSFFKSITIPFKKKQ